MSSDNDSDQTRQSDETLPPLDQGIKRNADTLFVATEELVDDTESQSEHDRMILRETC